MNKKLLILNRKTVLSMFFGVLISLSSIGTAQATQRTDDTGGSLPKVQEAPDVDEDRKLESSSDTAGDNGDIEYSPPAGSCFSLEAIELSDGRICVDKYYYDCETKQVLWIEEMGCFEKKR